MVRSVHAPVEGCVSLLSLIPCLIKQSVAFWWCLWVWLGGTLLLLGFGHGPVLCGRRLGTLLGPEETPLLWVLFSGPLLAWPV